jgi:hypothetical protein
MTIENLNHRHEQLIELNLLHKYVTNDKAIQYFRCLLFIKIEKAKIYNSPEMLKKANAFKDLLLTITKPN